MADGQHKLSRRALLGAVCASTVIPAKAGTSGRPAPSLSPWDPGFRRNDDRVTPWDRALATFEKAQAALDAAAHTPDEDLYDRLGIRHDRAMRRLIRTPAPDLPALAAKLDLALDERSGEFFGDSADMKAIKSDARRLASLGRE